MHRPMNAQAALQIGRTSQQLQQLVSNMDYTQLLEWRDIIQQHGCLPREIRRQLAGIVDNKIRKVRKELVDSYLTPC